MSNPTEAARRTPQNGEADAASAALPPAFPVVGAILATAISAAEKRASPGDVAHGVMAALRHLRATADEEAGDAMASAIDDAVRQHLIGGAPSDLRGGATATALPAAGPGAAVAAAIMESAADSCLAVNAHAPDNSPLEIAVNALTFQMLRHLSGAPDWETVSRELRRPTMRHGAGPILPFRGVTVH